MPTTKPQSADVNNRLVDVEKGLSNTSGINRDESINDILRIGSIQNATNWSSESLAYIIGEHGGIANIIGLSSSSEEAQLIESFIENSGATDIELYEYAKKMYLHYLCLGDTEGLIRIVEKNQHNPSFMRDIATELQGDPIGFHFRLHPDDSTNSVDVLIEHVQRYCLDLEVFEFSLFIASRRSWINGIEKGEETLAIGEEYSKRLLDSIDDVQERESKRCEHLKQIAKVFEDTKDSDRTLSFVEEYASVYPQTVGEIILRAIKFGGFGEVVNRRLVKEFETLSIGPENFSSEDIIGAYLKIDKPEVAYMYFETRLSHEGNEYLIRDYYREICRGFIRTNQLKRAKELIVEEKFTDTMGGSQHWLELKAEYLVQAEKLDQEEFEISKAELEQISQRSDWYKRNIPEYIIEAYAKDKNWEKTAELYLALGYKHNVATRISAKIVEEEEWDVIVNIFKEDDDLVVRTALNLRRTEQFYSFLEVLSDPSKDKARFHYLGSSGRGESKKNIELLREISNPDLYIRGVLELSRKCNNLSQRLELLQGEQEYFGEDTHPKVLEQIKELSGSDNPSESIKNEIENAIEDGHFPIAFEKLSELQALLMTHSDSSHYAHERKVKATLTPYYLRILFTSISNLQELQKSSSFGDDLLTIAQNYDYTFFQNLGTIKAYQETDLPELPDSIMMFFRVGVFDKDLLELAGRLQIIAHKDIATHDEVSKFISQILSFSCSGENIKLLNALLSQYDDNPESLKYYFESLSVDRFQTKVIGDSKDIIALYERTLKELPISPSSAKVMFYIYRLGRKPAVKFMKLLHTAAFFLTEREFEVMVQAFSPQSGMTIGKRSEQDEEHPISRVYQRIARKIDSSITQEAEGILGKIAGSESIEDLRIGKKAIKRKNDVEKRKKKIASLCGEQRTQKYAGREIDAIFEPYIEVYIYDILKKKIGSLAGQNDLEFNLEDLPENFIDVCKILKSPSSNAFVGQRLLAAYLQKKTYPFVEDISQSWAYQEGINPLTGEVGKNKNAEFINHVFDYETRKVWFSKNRVEIDVSSEGETSNLDDSMNHHFRVASQILGRYRIDLHFDNTQAFIDWWDKLEGLERNKLEIQMQGNDFDELRFEISEIKKLKNTVETQSNHVTSISIERSLDPTEILMMGNWVDGSCLSFYSSIGNYWSTISNAIDANKAVFYIRDQDNRVIGRVLLGITDDGKVNRFRIYTKGQIGINLNKHFNSYIKPLIEKCGLEATDEVVTHDVKNLIAQRWYVDPVESFGSDIEIQEPPVESIAA